MTGHARLDVRQAAVYRLRSLTIRQGRGRNSLRTAPVPSDRFAGQTWMLIPALFLSLLIWIGLAALIV